MALLQTERSARRSTVRALRKRHARFLTSLSDTARLMLNAAEGRAFVLLKRRSGLAIRDAVTLERSRVESHNRLILATRRDGRTSVRGNSHPCGRRIRSIPNGLKQNPHYFLWSGGRLPETAVADLATRPPPTVHLSQSPVMVRFTGSRGGSDELG